MRDYNSSSRVTVLLSKFSLPGAASQLSAGKSQSAQSWASPTDWLCGMTKRRDAVFENKFLFLLTFVCLLRGEKRHSSLLAASWFLHNWKYSMTNHLFFRNADRWLYLCRRTGATEKIGKVKESRGHCEKLCLHNQECFWFSSTSTQLLTDGWIHGRWFFIFFFLSWRQMRRNKSTSAALLLCAYK